MRSKFRSPSARVNHPRPFNLILLYVLYFQVTSCGTPIVYFIGIEENRTKTREFLRSNIENFVPKKDKMTVEIEMTCVIPETVNQSVIN